MGSRNYRDLVVWQKSMDLVTSVYEFSSEFPQAEQFGLTSQLRRAVISVPSNIAEGEGRQSSGDFRRFLAIAHGSLRETETQLMIAVRLGYAPQQQADELLEDTSEIGRMIQGLSRSLS